MNHYLRGGGVLVVAALLACGNEQPGISDSVFPSNVQDTIARYMAIEVKQIYGVAALDRDQIITESHESAAVPDLRLYYAEYRPRERLHLKIAVIVATRAGRIQIVRDQQDYISLSAGWAPASSREAIAACQEAVTASIQQQMMDTLPFFTASDSSHPGFLSDEWAEIMTRAHDPTAYQSRGGWEVTVWALQSTLPRGAVRYQCLLPRSGGGIWQVAHIDSVVVPEIPS